MILSAGFETDFSFAGGVSPMIPENSGFLL